MDPEICRTIATNEETSALSVDPQKDATPSQRLDGKGVLAEVQEKERRYHRRKSIATWTMIAVAHILLVILVIEVLIPGKRTPPTVIPFLASLAIVEAFYLWRLLRKGANKIAVSGIMLIWWAFLIAWETISTKLGCVSPVLFPMPEAVFNVFPTQWQTLLVNIGSSMQLLLMGAVTSIISGMILGAICGWIPGLRSIFAPIARVLAPIPSAIFAPYLVALMPTFRIASATVIFLGIFWPMFLNTIIRVTDMDKRIIEGAKMLELSSFEMVRDIILPYMLPGVINGLNGQLTAAMTMLTFAEMLGASSGLGYYIINYTNFANYVNVIAGIITVGLVVTLLNWLINVARRRLIHWC